MSIGQRIAQKRKELGLSQEALGEELGVSRQAIYKWESDGAVPEVEKLVQLSRRFGVSVGWLLGVEDEPPEGADSADSELNEQQLKMVEEIVSRYLAAQGKPAEAPAKPKRRWITVLAAVALVLAAWNLFSRLNQLDQQYSNLQNSVNQVYSTVNGQIGSISSRVEEVLKTQNRLTAEYDTELAETDPGTNTARFTVYAVPKTYVPGMRAEFIAESGGETVTLSCDEAERQRFSGEITCPLTDDISLSVVFIRPDGTRETQLLDNYDGLARNSYPDVMVTGYSFFGEELKDGVLTMGPTRHAIVRIDAAYVGDATVKSVQVGLFLNRKLVGWGAAAEPPWELDPDETYYLLPNVKLTMELGDRLEVAALVTDSYGRQFMDKDTTYEVQEGNGRAPLWLGIPDVDVWTPDSDLSLWTFD